MERLSGVEVNAESRDFFECVNEKRTGAACGIEHAQRVDAADECICLSSPDVLASQRCSDGVTRSRGIRERVFECGGRDLDDERLRSVERPALLALDR